MQSNNKTREKKADIYSCKVFVSLVNLFDIFNNIHKINKYLVKSIHKIYLVSKVNLYEVCEDNMYRMDIYDGPCEEYIIEDIPMIGQLEVIVDQSYIKVVSEESQEFQVPVDHKVDKALSKEYLLRKDGLVKLIIICDDNEEQMIRQFYFTINQNVDRKVLNEEIISFLHELNLC